MTGTEFDQAITQILNLFKETDARLDKLNAEVATRFKETDAKFKETDAKFKETDAKFKETDARLDKMFAETDEQFKQTRSDLKQMFAETNTQFKQTDARLNKMFAETDKRLRKLDGTFRSHWGRMIEALVKPSALRLFNQWGLNLTGVHGPSEEKRNGHTMEIDIILHNGNQVVVVEVKSTLHVQDVDDLLQDLAQFGDFFTAYRHHTLYGAVAALNFDENSDRYAYKRGLFVIGFSGEGMTVIKNDTTFQPRNFTEMAIA